MKKLILLTLIAGIPFFTLAQKKNKKKSDTKVSIKSDVNFMIIKGVEVDMSQEGISPDEIRDQYSDVSLDNIMRKHIKPVSQFYITYDVGGHSEDVKSMIASSTQFRSMVQAVKKAGEYGWEFVNATIVIDGPVKIHYYHMKK